MASVNKVILVGNVGRDPEVRTTPSGQTVAKFSLATSENFGSRSGERTERTEWHNIVAWGKQADLCKQYVTKGRQLYVEGRLQTSNWTDPQGQKRYRTEVIAQTIQFLGGRSDRPAAAAGAPAEAPEATEYAEPSDTGAAAFAADDDLPF